MKLARLLALAALAAATPACASVSPHPGPGDPHIQTVEYDAQQTVVLSVALNYALTLEFSPDERIQNVSVGNSAVWQVTASKSADRLFIKPMQGAVSTDMTVITDTRLYAFELTPSPSPNPDAAFVVRFTYPSAAQPAPASAAGAEDTIVSYRFGGARELRPLTMSDDGRRTMIAWPDGTAIPAISIIGADGKEALANGAVRDGRYVIDQVAGRFVFRAGGRTAFATRQVRRVRGR